MSSLAITADAAGSWQLGDLTVSRLGFGAMRLTGSVPMGPGAPSDRRQSLAVLRDAGLIRHLGLSEVTTAHLAEALAIAPVVCVQNRFSLDTREHEDVLRASATGTSRSCRSSR